MAGAYDRFTFRGRTFDRITARYVEHVEYLLGAQVPIFQGPYSRSVSQSAGTHDLSGVVDLGKPDGKTWSEVEWVCRLAGGAGWWRRESSSWDDHVHTIVLGNRNLAYAAQKQVQDFYAGLDGLASHQRDDARRPNPIVRFRYPMGRVDLSSVRAEALKKRGHKPLAGVKHVQRALNLKSGTELAVDGIYGPMTRRAVARYERQNGGDGDGLLALPVGRLLGAARFELHE